MSNAELMDGLQAIVTTLEDLDIKATFSNLDKLLGCQQLIRAMINELKNEEVKEDGNADAE